MSRPRVETVEVLSAAGVLRIYRDKLVSLPPLGWYAC